MALNKMEFQRCLRWWRALEANSRVLPAMLVSELISDRDTLSDAAQIMAGMKLAMQKVLPPLTEIGPGEVVLPFNYIEQGFSGILEQVPGTAYTIDVHTIAAGTRLGVILFLPDDTELHACIRLLPGYDMGAYLVFQRALQPRNLLKIGKVGHLHEVYQNMIQPIIECWELL